MSISPESPWRGGAAFLSQPIKDTDERAAEMVVETIYGFNCRSPPAKEEQRLGDIEYRSSDGEKDVQRHVFRWDRAPYDFVFINGFEARRQAGTPNETYYNLELYVNSGGRPLDVRRETTHAFVSTTLSSSWFPRVNPGVVDRVYRYEIYAPGGIWVAETLGDRYRFAAQDEVAFPAGIAPQYIRSAQFFELYTERQHPRRRRVDTTLFINTNFNPQSHPPRSLRIQRPVCDYNDEDKRRKKLVIQEFPKQKQKRAVAVTNDASTTESYIDSAFRSLRTDQAYLFIRNEYITKGVGASGSTSDDRIINGPLFISSGYPCLVGTAFAEYGIDAAFSCEGVDEAFIFCSNLCAKIKYAPGTRNDKLIQGPKTIKQMFPFFKGTEFERGVDAAFESTVTGEAYLFKGSSYARINYSKPALIGRLRLITEGFRCFRNTIFESDIGAAFASHKPNEAYLFKDNKYVLLQFTPGTDKDSIKEGPKDIVPNNWKSLKDILPHPNRGLDYYDSGKLDPQRDQDS